MITWGFVGLLVVSAALFMAVVCVAGPRRELGDDLAEQERWGRFNDAMERTQR